MEGRAAIRRLRAGIVPSSQLERLSVGYGRVKQAISQGLDGLAAGERPKALFVRGEWGTGKTHYLSFVRATAKARALPSALVDLNARSSALNHPQRFFASIAETICTAERMGLREIILEILENHASRTRLTDFANSAGAGDLALPLIELRSKHERADHLNLQDSPAWSVLHGGDLSWADYKYKRERATARIGALGLMLRAVGQHGLVILFDEAETVDQLWNVRSRLSAYGVMGQLCRAPHVWCVFGITDRFKQTVHDDLTRGALTYDFTSESARWFLTAWQRGQFDIVEPPTLGPKTAPRLAQAVAQLYDDAYDLQRVDERLIERCVDEWLQNPSRNPRRLIRLLIHRLDVARHLETCL